MPQPRAEKLRKMRYAGETACATNGESLACIGGTGFSLSTPACGRIVSHLLREGLPQPGSKCVCRNPSRPRGHPVGAVMDVHPMNGNSAEVVGQVARLATSRASIFAGLLAI